MFKPVELQSQSRVIEKDESAETLQEIAEEAARPNRILGHGTIFVTAPDRSYLSHAAIREAVALALLSECPVVLRMGEKKYRISVSRWLCAALGIHVNKDAVTPESDMGIPDSLTIKEL